MKVQAIRTLILAVAAMLVGTLAMAQGYTIRAGDTLSIEVLEDSSLNRTALVLPDGTISFPFAGSIRAAGQTSGQVESAIEAGIASQFASAPNVFVNVQTVRTGGGTGGTIHVYMVGQINEPGEKHLKRGSSLIQALASTGGFTKFAATKRIILRRTDSSGKQSIKKINYKAIADGTAVGNDVVLRDGDVIIVPERRLFE